MEKLEIVCLHCGAKHELRKDENSDNKVALTLTAAGKNLAGNNEGKHNVGEEKKFNLVEFLFGE